MSSFRVANPPDGAVYLIDPTLRREYQTLPLRAVADAAGTIDWRIDGQPVGRARADASVAWPLAAGRHVVSARDQRGRETTASIVVK
jgi:membrane carboxypeptidase/penicillin-binding protein PbpC